MNRPRFEATDFSVTQEFWKSLHDLKRHHRKSFDAISGLLINLKMEKESKKNIMREFQNWEVRPDKNKFKSQGLVKYSVKNGASYRLVTLQQNNVIQLQWVGHKNEATNWIKSSSKRVFLNKETQTLEVTPHIKSN